MSKVSKLKAVAPKEAEPSKPKVLIYGKPGVGKTWASLSWPSVYYCDTEGGADLAHYTDKLASAGGVYFGPEHGSLDFASVVEQVQALATEEHAYKTLVIDSISELWNASISAEQKRLGDKDAYGASKKPAKAFMRQLILWLKRIDMNVILIAHERDTWGNEGKTGVTFDGDDKLEYQLHLSLNIIKSGPKRVARVGKTRLKEFIEGESFEWSFENFAEKYGRDVINRRAQALTLATEDQVKEIKRLLEIVKLPDGQADKWLNAASAEKWEDVDSDKITACINALKTKVITGEAA